ncbi:MAG: helix-turn-helix domain-containing protein, partial [Panacibacter sp.]
PGNVRELKNIAEQISVLSVQQNVTGKELRNFLPDKSSSRLPVLASNAQYSGEFANEREILYKLFFDMKKDVTELKKMFLEILQNPSMVGQAASYTKESLLNDYSNMNGEPTKHVGGSSVMHPQLSTASNSQPVLISNDDEIHQHEEVEESLNIMDKEKELIIKALKKHKGKRKDASSDLGISERTLYRKLKEYDIDE